MKISVVCGYAPSLLNFRGPLLTTLINRGHSVVALAPSTDISPDISQQLSLMGVRIKPFYLSRVGLNPFQDFRSLLSLFRLLISDRQDYVYAYTVKPVIYTGLALRFCRCLTATIHPSLLAISLA